MSDYDALASFIVLSVPLVGLVVVLHWWLCPLEGAGVQDASDQQSSNEHLAE